MAQQDYTARFRDKYHNEVVPALKERFQYKNDMQVPRLLKVCINKGVGAATSDKKLIDIAQEEISNIAGQKAVPVNAKKSVSNFKLREGMPIAVRVTLRNDRMYEFVDRLLTIALPRVRDFRGVNDKSFDGRGNYTLGVTEQIIFPEISLDKVKSISGMDITFVTSAETDEEALVLLKLMGFPFANQNK